MEHATDGCLRVGSSVSGVVEFVTDEVYEKHTADHIMVMLEGLISTRTSGGGSQLDLSTVFDGSDVAFCCRCVRVPVPPSFPAGKSTFTFVIPLEVVEDVQFFETYVCF